MKPGDFSRNLAIALLNTLRDSTSEETAALRLKLAPLVRARLSLEPDLVARDYWNQFLDS